MAHVDQNEPEDSTLLTDLCAICHANRIRYTCPRCFIHTCSAPCVKRHKQRARCSGVRDPAEYRKRSELATASSIDKDFNFITGVERSLLRAGENVTERGIRMEPARVPHVNSRWNGTANGNRNGKFNRDAADGETVDTRRDGRIVQQPQRPKHELEIEERGVTVIKAPKGLSRSKANKTHWANQQNCIMWTIEWIGPDDEKITGQAVELRTIAEAYVNAIGKKNVRKKRKRAVSMSDKERAEGGGVEEEKAEPPATGERTQSEQNEKSADTARSNGKDEIHGDGGDQQTIVTNPNTRNDDKNRSEQARDQTVNNRSQDLTGQFCFYLHRPDTPANFKCLIPLQQETTLGRVLEKRTVIEFPTIFVRFENPNDLAPPFITEEEFLSRHGKDIPINVTMPNPHIDLFEEGEIDSAPAPIAATASNVDAAKVIEVLAQDLAG